MSKVLIWFLVIFAVAVSKSDAEEHLKEYG